MGELAVEGRRGPRRGALPAFSRGVVEPPLLPAREQVVDHRLHRGAGECEAAWRSGLGALETPVLQQRLDVRLVVAGIGLPPDPTVTPASSRRRLLEGKTEDARQLDQQAAPDRAGPRGFESTRPRREGWWPRARGGGRRQRAPSADRSEARPSSPATLPTPDRTEDCPRRERSGRRRRLPPPRHANRPAADRRLRPRKGPGDRPTGHGRRARAAPARAVRETPDCSRRSAVVPAGAGRASKMRRRPTGRRRSATTQRRRDDAAKRRFVISVLVFSARIAPVIWLVSAVSSRPWPSNGPISGRRSGSASIWRNQSWACPRTSSTFRSSSIPSIRSATCRREK